jgi:3-phenylpropionate/cinnamic acid dioxygenase small subunit
MSTPAAALEDTATMSSARQIENLIARYAELVDGGDFDGLGRLLAQAAFSLNGGEPIFGASEISRLATDTLVVHSDQTPRTHHVTTNLLIEINEPADTAIARSYFTVIQQAGDRPLQLVAAGRYRDQFSRRAGPWLFTARAVISDFFGDTSQHVRPQA